MRGVPCMRGLRIPVATVLGQLAAAREVADDIGDQYRLMAEATAIRAGRRTDIQKWR